MILVTQDSVFRVVRKLIYSRNSSIPKLLANQAAYIHTGRRFRRRFITKWVVGFKYGALTWNRRLAIYKAKQMRKKKNKKKK